jgi:hypothetical protein
MSDFAQHICYLRAAELQFRLSSAVRATQTNHSLPPTKILVASTSSNAFSNLYSAANQRMGQRVSPIIVTLWDVPSLGQLRRT